jgi:GGDEF domain-containing protein
MPDLKVLLRPGGPSSAEYVRLLQKTVNDVIPAAPEGDVQAVRLKTGLTAILSRITEQATVEELTNAVDTATDLLRKYHSGAAQRASQQLMELKGVMRTMTETITFLSESRSTVVHQLTFVERQLEAATELDDIRLLRPRLAECLELVRQETARLQAESAAHTEAVRQKMGLGNQSGDAAPSRRLGSLDVATGLPNRSAAERLIAEKSGSGLRCSLAVFVPERLGFVAKRHGREAEDEVLLHVAQHLTKLIPSGSYLYRWTGPALLALRVSSDTPEHDEQVWRHIAGKSCEKTIGNERRSALLRITLACYAVHTGDTPASELLGKLDEFVTQSIRE